MLTQEVKEIHPGQRKVKEGWGQSFPESPTYNPPWDLIFWSPWTLGQVWALVSLMTNTNSPLTQNV